MQLFFFKLKNLTKNITITTKKKKTNSIENQDNKSSINDKNSTSDDSKSSFATEGEKLGPSDFFIHGLIGEGSFGEVYLAEKKGSMILYAMKVL